MPAKQLRFDTEARQLLRRGVDSVADAVAVTLGLMMVGLILYAVLFARM